MDLNAESDSSKYRMCGIHVTKLAQVICSILLIISIALSIFCSKIFPELAVYFIVGIILEAVSLFLAVYGIRKRRPKYLLPFIIFRIVCIVIIIILLICNVYLVTHTNNSLPEYERQLKALNEALQAKKAAFYKSTIFDFDTLNREWVQLEQQLTNLTKEHNQMEQKLAVINESFSMICIGTALNLVFNIWLTFIVYRCYQCLNENKKVIQGIPMKNSAPEKILVEI